MLLLIMNWRFWRKQTNKEVAEFENKNGYRCHVCKIVTLQRDMASYGIKNDEKVGTCIECADKNLIRKK